VKHILPHLSPLAAAAVMAALLTGCAYGEGQTAPLPLADDATIKLSGAPQKCIQMSQLDHSDVIDNDTIDFHVGRKVYRNRLSSSCPGLKSEDRILIENRTGSLCSLDVVYTLYDYGGQLTRGAACGLGEFQPIEKVKKAK
jgi:Family of unknown function (DUF6491)